MPTFPVVDETEASDWLEVDADFAVEVEVEVELDIIITTLVRVDSVVPVDCSVLLLIPVELIAPHPPEAPYMSSDAWQLDWTPADATDAHVATSAGRSVGQHSLRSAHQPAPVDVVIAVWPVVEVVSVVLSELLEDGQNALPAQTRTCGMTHVSLTQSRPSEQGAVRPQSAAPPTSPHVEGGRQTPADVPVAGEMQHDSPAGHMSAPPQGAFVALLDLVLVVDVVPLPVVPTELPASLAPPSAPFPSDRPESDAHALAAPARSVPHSTERRRCTCMRSFAIGPYASGVYLHATGLAAARRGARRARTSRGSIVAVTARWLRVSGGAHA